MKQLSRQRRKVIVLAASAAAMSGAAPMLMRDHPVLGFVWLGCMGVLMVCLVAQYAKLRGEDD